LALEDQPEFPMTPKLEWAYLALDDLAAYLALEDQPEFLADLLA